MGELDLFAGVVGCDVTPTTAFDVVAFAETIVSVVGEDWFGEDVVEVLVCADEDESLVVGEDGREGGHDGSG